MNEKSGMICAFIEKNCIKDVIVPVFIGIFMANRVSFSPVIKVLTYSPMDSVAELGKTKKRAVMTTLSTNKPTVTDILPFGGGATEGTQTFMSGRIGGPI